MGYSRNQVGLELVQIDVERTIESEGSGDGGNDLSNQPVQVGKTGGLDVQVLLANVIDSFVVDLIARGQHTASSPTLSGTYHERAIRVLEGGVSGQDRVVGLNHRVGEGGGGVHAELELGLLAVVG